MSNAMLDQLVESYNARITQLNTSTQLMRDGLLRTHLNGVDNTATTIERFQEMVEELFQGAAALERVSRDMDI